MSIDLESLRPAIEARAATWARLDMRWKFHPVAPNHGKPVIHAEFESETWIGDIMIWITGETELATVRLADDFMVNKHYDLLAPDDLDVLFNELKVLLSEDAIPESAVTGERRAATDDNERRTP